MIYEEIWKNVDFKLDFELNYRLEVSNKGRLRTFTKHQSGNIITGSLSEKYKIVRITFHKPRSEKAKQKLLDMKQQLNNEIDNLKVLKLELDSCTEKRLKSKLELAYTAEEKILEKAKKKYRSTFNAELKKRAVYWAELVHRLVAEAFCEKENPAQNLVMHIDYSKLNNVYTNLKWATQAEVTLHTKQAYKPFKKITTPQQRVKNSKLTVPNVMLIKKKLNQGKTLRSLAKLFNISEMQISRIKNGVNWKHVKAAN